MISAPTRALLLLTGDFGGGTPLDAVAFERLVGWLRKRGMQPDDLLQPDAAKRLAGRGGAATAAPVLALLRRQPLLAAALERWEANGLWVLGRTDPEYPRRLKRRLRAAAPKLLFGCGDRMLLNRGGIALVGGDEGGSEPEDFAAGFGAAAAATGLTTLSGGGNAIEAAALRAGLSRGGAAIAVLPNRLAAEARSDRLRRPAADGLLVCVSTTLPDEEAEAPARSRAAEECLYGLADTVLMVAVGRRSARWAGAIAANERGWVPLWARRADPEAGELARMGAGLLSGDPVSPRTLLEPPAAPGRGAARPVPMQPMASMPMAFVTAAPGPSLVGFAEAPAPFGAEDGDAFAAPSPTPAAGGSGERGPHLRLVASADADARAQPAGGPAAERGLPGAMMERGLPGATERSLYDIFVQRVAMLLTDEGLGAWRIADALGVTEHQAETWLRRAEGAGLFSVDPLTRLYRSGGTR